MPSIPRLTRIRVCPLKGAAGFDLKEKGMDEFGIPEDRRWMVTTRGGRHETNRASSGKDGQGPQGLRK